jgi:uncharacterized protein YbjT (DUF2867 family)
VRRGDFTDPDSLADAFEGATHEFATIGSTLENLLGHAATPVRSILQGVV